jgi:hypothetical protein
MMTAVLMANCLLCGALFEVEHLPAKSADALCFIGQSGEDTTADLFVLDGFHLTLYEDAETRLVRELDLMPGTSALDVADIDGDGLCELVTVCGDKIMRYDLETNGFRTPETMFSLKTTLAGTVAHPFLHVMAVRRDNKLVIALPCENTFELHAVDGTLVESFSIGMDAPHRMTYGSPFNLASVDPPQLGGPGALDLRVSRMLAFKPDLPENILPMEVQNSLYRRGTLRQAREAADREPESWPWFPVKRDAAVRDRAYYAVTGSGSGDTLVRVQYEKPGVKAGEKELVMGPERRYPGAALVTEDDLPDFNKDGFVDLVLWRVPEPAPTVDALARAVSGGRWPIWITTHCYLPDNRRFSPKATGRIVFHAPLSSFLSSASGSPLQHVVLRDFDGDGVTDFACCTAPDTYAVWRTNKNGFSDRPDFEQHFPEPISRVALRVDLDGRGRTSLVLRTASAFYVLRAVAPPAFTGTRPPATP